MDEKLSMLIADNTSINRTLLRNIFNEEYKIIEAYNGQDVLDIVHREEIDIILLDICMPDMDGMEVLRELNQDSRYSKIPIIVNTIMGDPVNEIQALRLGADEFITKPYNPQVIKRRVSNIASKYVLKQKQMTKDLEYKSQQLKMLVDTVPGGIGTLENGKKIRCTYFNGGLCGLLGYDTDTFFNQAAEDMEAIVFEEDREKFRGFMQEGTDGEELARCTIRFIKKDGSRVWLGLSARREKDSHAQASCYTFFTDMTEEKNVMQELLVQVEKDPLTGIYNRRTFYERTRSIIEEHPEEAYVIVQWNIDRFKVINALYGSQCGDEVLKRCADLLQHFIGGYGICGRLEADHFVGMITMEYVSCNLSVMEKLLSEGIRMEQIDYPIMLHAGFYEVTERSQSIDVMCDCANLALQEVKKSYLKRWEFFDEEMRQNLLNEQALINEMEQALNSRQFVIRLQPIYDAATHEIVSAEALVRWQHPHKGLISPAVFIPLFEKNGFIAKLDIFVWEEVCRMLAENREAGRKNVPISVNVSRINFYNPELLSEINVIVEKYQIDHSMLKFEVTESAYMENPDQLIQEMERIKAKGFSILMDDFGSGYSSLNTLKDVPVDILKIDMKFLDHLEKSPKATSILYSVIRMAQGLEISVIVEGVETKNQFEMLKSMGCEYIQGYYFSRPLSIEEFRKHLETGRIRSKRQRTDVKKAILVIDDTEFNRVSVSSVMSDDYQVYEAENGKEALEILHANPLGISLIITDIMMPVMDGFEFLKKMQSQHLLNKIPVLVLTTLEDVENEIKAISLGALDVVTRPFDPLLLAQRIRNLLKISENNNIQAEIHSLKENFEVNHHIEGIINSDLVELCNVKYEENGGRYRLLSLEYANNGYFEMHGMKRQENIRLGTEDGIFENIVKEEREDVVGHLFDAFNRKAEFVQNIYDILKDERITTVISTGRIRYEENGLISLALFEVPVHAEEILIQKHLLGNMIQDLFNDTQIKVWCYDIPNNRFFYKSQKLEKRGQIEYIANDTEETLLRQGFSIKDMERMHSMHRRIRQGELSVRETFKIHPQQKSGSGAEEERFIRIVYKSFLSPGKESVLAFGMMEDITGEIEMEQLKRQELHYRRILNKGVLLFADVDIANNTFVIERSSEDKRSNLPWCITYDKALKRYIREFIHPKEVKMCGDTLSCSRLKEMYEQGIRNYQIEFRGKITDKRSFEWYMVSLFFSENGENKDVIVNLQLRNIQTEHYKLQVMRRQAERDIMTGCYNRATFEKMVNQICRDKPAGVSAFIMIDTDNFKMVNDAFGHDTGDAVLKTLAELLKKTFRKEDVIGRLGGDEFAVFVHGAGARDAICKKVEEICRHIYMPLEDNGKRVVISCSVGVAFSSEEDRSFLSMYRQADQSLYKAKRLGKNTYYICDN